MVYSGTVPLMRTMHFRLFPYSWPALLFFIRILIVAPMMLVGSSLAQKLRSEVVLLSIVMAR